MSYNYNDRMAIDRKWGRHIKDKFGTYFHSDDLFSQRESYNTAVKIFKYLFSLGEEGKIYLWNNWLYCLNDEKTIELIDYMKTKSDFKNEEINFIRNISTDFNNLIGEYKSFFEGNHNINDDIYTDRLILKPYDEELSRVYQDFLLDNEAEFEDYFHEKYDYDAIESMHLQKEFRYHFAILLKESKDYIGSVGITLKRANSVYNLEYIILPEHRQKGYAFEATTALLDIIKTNKLSYLENSVFINFFNLCKPTIKVVEAIVLEDNKKSINLVEKLGFMCNGKILNHSFFQDKYYDAYIYDLVIE